MPLSDYLVSDDLTIILGLVAGGLFLLHNLYKPQSLVHPILLGRQSDAARVRNPGESAVYRNYSTGMMGRFPARPSKDQQVLLDLVKPDLDSPRTLWFTKLTNPELRQRVSALGTGLVRVGGLVPGESNVLMLLNDGIELLLTDLALSSHAIPSFTLTSMSLLSQVLDEHPPSAIITHAEFLTQLLELIYDDTHEGSHHTVIVVGELSAKMEKTSNQVRLLRWTVVELQGAQMEQVPASPPDSQRIFSVSFHATPSGEVHGTQITHENITAGITAIRALLPSSGPLSPLDTVISAHSMASAYGRAVAYTAVFEGASFATVSGTKLVGTDKAIAKDLTDLKSVDSYPIPSPTVLFITPTHLQALASSILAAAQKSSLLLYPLAWRHKLSGVLEGFITKQSLWDRLVFDHARMDVMGAGAGTVRAVIVSGGPVEAHTLTPSRIALSVPLIFTYSHPVVAGPVLATHTMDLQSFPAESSSGGSAAENYTFSYLAPFGAPAINIETKLLGVDDAAIEGGSDPIGDLVLRGPAVGSLLDVELNENEEDRGWVATGERARVLPNGTFKVTAKKQ